MVAMSGCARCRCTTALSTSRPPANVWRWACREPSAAISTGATCSSRRTPFGLLPPRCRARGAGTDRERRARVGASRHLPHCGESGEGGRATAQLRLTAPVVAVRGDRVVLRGDDARGRDSARSSAAAPPRGGTARAARAGRSGLDRGGDGRRARRDRIARGPRPPFAGRARARARGGRTRRRVGVLAGMARRHIGFDRGAPRGSRRRIAARSRPPGGDAPAGRAVGARDPRAPAAGAARRDGVPAGCRGIARGAREAAEALGRELESAGLAALKVDDGELARYLEGDGVLVRLGDGFAVSADAYRQARDLVVEECRQLGRSRWRDSAT